MKETYHEAIDLAEKHCDDARGLFNAIAVIMTLIEITLVIAGVCQSDIFGSFLCVLACVLFKIECYIADNFSLDNHDVYHFKNISKRVNRGELKFNTGTGEPNNLNI